MKTTRYFKEDILQSHSRIVYVYQSSWGILESAVQVQFRVHHCCSHSVSAAGVTVIGISILCLFRVN